MILDFDMKDVTVHIQHNKIYDRLSKTSIS